MDPVSLAASVITLVGATKSTSAALRRFWELKQAPDNIASIINEVTDFEAALVSTADLEKFLQGPEHAEVRQSLKVLLSRANEQVEAIKNFAESQFRSTNNHNQDAHTKPKMKMKKRAKLKEVIGENKRKLETLREQLASTKISLSVALQIQQFALSMNIQQITVFHAGDSFVSSTTNSSSLFATQIEEIVSTNPIGPTDATSDLVPHLTKVSQIPPPALDDNQPYPKAAHKPAPATAPLPADVSPSSPSHDTDVHQSPDTTSLTTVWPPTCTSRTSGSYLAIRTKLIQRNCPPWCSCQCHIPFQASTPQWLRGLFGGLFFKLRGAPVLSRQACNSPHCGTSGSKVKSVQFQYYFPLWLLPLGISVTGSWNDLRGRGATWTFKIPRTIPPGSFHNDLLYIIQNESVESAKQYMAVNQIAAIDVFEYDGLHLFERAVNLGLIEFYSMLLQNGASLSLVTHTGWTYGQYLFQELLLRGWNAIPQILEADDFDVELDHLGFTPLHKGVLRLTDHTVASCIDFDPSTIIVKDVYGFTPLHWATCRDDIETVQTLLKAGADPNAICKKGKTSLIWAAELASAACCRALVVARADVRIADSEGRTALHRAASRSEYNPNIALGIVRVLLEHGAEINSQDKYGITCLTHAAEFGSADLCDLLLSYGADTEATGTEGFSAVFFAVQMNHAAVIKLLRDGGARLNRLNKWGSSLIGFAAEFGSIEVMQVLREARIQGLRMDTEAVERYWSLFDFWRDHSFRGQRASVEIERAEFELLLQSVMPNTEPIIDNTPSIPGAFPDDEDFRSNAATDSSASDEDELSDEDERETDSLQKSQSTK